MSSDPNHQTGATTAQYNHRRFLLQLSEKLTKEDSKKIVYLEDLPKELEDKSPWEVLGYLEMRGQTSTEELTRIFRGINRNDVAKKMKDLNAKTRKSPLSRKNSGSAGLKLEESLHLTTRNTEVLIQQIEYMKLAANKAGEKDSEMEETFFTIWSILKNQIHPKLKNVSGLLSKSKDNEFIASSSSSASSPECLTDIHLVQEKPPMQPCGAVINDAMLKVATEKLKPSALSRGCLLYTSPSPRDATLSRMPSSA